jgi:hypothetical protein
MSENRQSSEKPTIEPGQVWLIEQLSETELSPIDRGALTRANVVLYDRALEKLVAELLPLGGYAEPLPRDHRAAGSAVAPRALQFAADGWSVVQLIEARPGRQDAVRPASNGREQMVVQIIARPPAGRDQDDDEPVTRVFGPFGVRGAAQAQVFTANGLAG